MHRLIMKELKFRCIKKATSVLSPLWSVLLHKWVWVLSPRGSSVYDMIWLRLGKDHV